MHIVRLTGFFWLSLDPLYFPTGKESGFSVKAGPMLVEEETTTHK